MREVLWVARMQPTLSRFPSLAPRGVAEPRASEHAVVSAGLDVRNPRVNHRMAKKAFVADFSLSLINRSGAYYVCRDIIEQLAPFFLAVRYWRLFLGQEPRGFKRKLLGRAMLFELKHVRFAETFPRPRAPMKSDAMTLFFDPLYVLRTSLKPEDIVLCHDVGPLTHPELFDAGTTELYRLAFARIAAVGPGMVFVSEASRSAFRTLFANNFRFQHVIQLYVRKPLAIGEMEAPAGIRVPFLLTVAGVEKRKNHRRIIEAFAASGLREQGYSYVFCGPRGNSAPEVRLLAQTPGVRALGYLADSQLRWLYRNASGFVLPSLLEGFGLPALEAAQHGLVSVVSAGGAQEEAAGKGAILIDPTSIAAIAKAMRQLVEMPACERDARVELLRGQAATLSQERYLAKWTDLLASQ
jgi:glycosyltransferase involved in cell wall biosynthesis